jgi:hypothetical protein
MLPVVGRRELGSDAAGYGALLGCMGAGAVAGAPLLKRLRKTVAANTISVWQMASPSWGQGTRAR